MSIDASKNLSIGIGLSVLLSVCNYCEGMSNTDVRSQKKEYELENATQSS